MAWFIRRPVALAVVRAWPDPAVELRDRRNRPVTKAGVRVTLRVTTPGVTLVSPKSVLTNSGGVAVFRHPLFTFSGASPMAITLAFESAGLEAASATVTLNPVAAKLAFVTAPRTPSHAPVFSAKPSTRSGLVGGGITTSGRRRNPNRP